MLSTDFDPHKLVRDGQDDKQNRERNYHVHDLRSYFASELIRRNTNPLVVQNLFAHSDMSITNIYADTDADLMLEAVKRLDDTQESLVTQRNFA